MLARGYLAAASVYVSLAHTDEIVDRYLEDVNKVFEILAAAVAKNDVSNRLRTAPRSDAFQRLTR